METVSNICAVIVGVSIFVIPVLFVVWLIRNIMKKPAKKIGKAAIVVFGCAVVFTMVGSFTDPATYCDHEYELVESEAATCEKGGYEKYHCGLCGRGKTEKLKKLGHDVKEIRRVNPIFSTDGEIVKKCSRCGYEEIEVLEKLKSTVKPTEPEKKSTEPSETLDLSVTYDDIYLAYKENELVANDLYRYNRYRITAKINGMATGGLLNLTGGATLTMETRVGNTIVFFYAEFEKEQEEALKQVKVGDTITFEGECLGRSGFDDCALVSGGE